MGATTLSSTLAVTNATTLSSTLDVTGNTTITGDTSISGNTSMTGTLAVSGTITLGDPSGSSTGGAITTSASTITIDPHAVGDNTGTLVIAGDLKVQGTTTTVNSTTVQVGDNIIVLAKDQTGAASVNGGIEIERGDDTNVQFIWDETNDKWSTENKDLTLGTGNFTVNGNVTHNNVTTTITEIADRIATLEKYFRIYSDGTIQIGDDNTATVYLPGTQHFGTTNPTLTYYNSDYAGATTSKGTAS